MRDLMDTKTRENDKATTMEAVALASNSADEEDDEPFISIGIDFGTTFSGVAWALSTSPHDIFIVDTWELQDMPKMHSHKVPSVLTYNSKAEVASFGFGLDRNRVVIECFKLLLSEQATEELAKSRPNEHKKLQAKLKDLEKEPSDVVGDYLRCLWHHVVEVIEMKLSRLLWENVKLKIMLTIPTIWDYKSQRMLRRSAEKAGLLDRTGTLLEFVCDSEAAAIAVLSGMRLQQGGNLKVGDTFIVCDAGAVEVSLNSYQIEHLRPLRLRECSPATGGHCGSSFLDVAFEKQIRLMISNEEFDKLSHRSKRKMMNDWERGVKRYFDTSNKNNTWHVDIPGFQGIYNPNDHSLDDLDEINSGTLELRTDHLEAIFSHVCSQIINLVNAQRGAIRLTTGKEPNLLLLVGGFGENKYLRELLHLSFGNESIQIQQPAWSWTAACRGAVLKGLENDTFINHVSGGRVDMENSKETTTSVGTSYAPSIFSVESMDSSWSHLSEEEFESAAAELVSLLLNDEYLKPLYSKALESPKIGRQRFETNFRRLIKKFAVDLRKEAKDPLQVQAAKFVGAQASLVAANIREALQTHGGTKFLPILADLEAGLAENPSIVAEEEQQYMLDLSIRKWISMTDTSSYPEVSQVPDTDDADLSSLVEVKQFILSSDAFVALRHNFTNFVHPPIEPSSEEAGQDIVSEEKTKHESMPSHPEQEDQPKEVPTDSLDLEPFQLYYNGRTLTLIPWNLVPSIGFIDHAKAVVERFIHCRIIWWPFAPRNTNCLKDHVRVTWYCDCGALLYFDTPTPLARKLISHCIPLDRGMSGSLLPVHHGPSQSSSVDPDQGHAKAHNSGPRTRTNQDASVGPGGMNLNLSPQVKMTPNLSSTYLHWCVDSTPSDTLLFSLEIPRIDDTKIIKRLKHCYKSVKGVRRWISLTDCEGVKFVLFKRGVQRRTEDLIVCLKEDLPAKTDPNYMYLDTEPPELLKDFAAQTLKHHLINPHKCSNKDVEEIMLLVPKKVNGLLERKFGIVGWGVLAVPGLAIWKCFIALALSQIPPAIFAIRWLLGHPGDLQNAFLLSFYILGALNVILIIPEKWSLRRARF